MEKGSPDHLLVRYRYQFKNLLRYGLTAEKDAGEPFGKGGFDFYSAHVFARHIGHIEAVALGDFTVNLGQGLVQWQGLAFKKSGDIVAIKRQGPVLQPYGSSGETGFERGVGATLQQGRFQATAYWSRLKRDGNVVADSVGSGWVSSLPASGLHRSAAERADRKAVIQTDAGANLRLLLKDGQVGLTVVAGRLSKALKPGPEPYHRFDLQGRQWLNAGVDYSYTIANMHVFGEAAFNRDGDGAVVSGLLLSVDPRLDVAFLGRRIGVRYRAMSGDAFTESVTPGNESGAYVGVAVRPSAAWRVEGYVDVYASKGLRFRVNGPSRGTDCLLQATHTPLRGTELYLRYRVERKDGNGDGPAPVPAVVPHLRQTIRLQAVCPLSPVVTLKCRTELAWYDKRSAGGEAGFLGFAEAAVKPPGKFSGNARLQYFETGGYETRLFTYESDVPGGALIPAFSGKGFRYYVNFGVDLTRKLGVDLRFARTVFNEGRGAEIIGGEGVAARRTEAKIQAHYTFQGF
ncbi:MAG: helix-hairpin-helix protein [Flaviaesturariibacter sp.]|nr:helix-hairpin-helix protein [Flaviaesturariibacter sp.]